MRVGDVVAGRFELVATAGMGGMGVVYRARDLVAGEQVAVKTLRDGGDQETARFAREAAVLVELAHPGIVRYVAHGRHGHEPFLAMEWIDGTTLHDRLNANRGISVAEAVALGRACAAALAGAHRRGIVHRDLKPANVMLVGGVLANVKLLDFGIARQASTAGVLTKTGVVVGTPGYMSPEQVRGEVRAVDARSDVFSLGCVLYRCLVGVPAFAGDSLAVLAKILVDEVAAPGAQVSGVPKALDELVLRMLAKAPVARPADAGEVEAELGRIAATLAPDATLATTGSSPRDSYADTVLAAPGPTNSPAITTTEHRIVTIVLAAPVGSAATPAPDPGRITTIASAFGGRADAIFDGSGPSASLVVFAHAGAATDHAAGAARCALALRDEIPALALAIASGRAAVEGPLAGDAIDRAAALLVDLPASAIAVDDATRTLLDHRFDLASAPPRGGAARPGEARTFDLASAPPRGGGTRSDEARGPDVSGSRLLGMRDAEPARLLLGRASPLVGRDRELANLAGLWADCVDEPVARAVVITAPAGAGKSRLRAEMERAILARDPQTAVLVGRGDAVGAGSPFAMLTDLVRRAAGANDGDALDTQRQALLARVRATVAEPDVDRVAHLLGELAGVGFPSSASQALRAARADATAKADLTRAAWVDWLAAESAAHPVLIVLDDLHWGDTATVDYVDAALRHLPAAPVMVVALARPEVHDLFPRLWHDRDVQDIRLPALTRKAAERLIREMLGDLDAATVQRIVERADGNAFFLEELIRAVADGRQELPESVLAMLQQRLDALDPDTRRALRAASTFGELFWRGGVIALTGADERAAHVTDTALAELARRELISATTGGRLPGEREYAFRHDLVRGAAYATMTDADRALAHRLAGGWLAARGFTDALVLADHFALGGDTRRAAEQFAVAAERAYSGGDSASALAHIRRALACAPTGETLGQLELVHARTLNWIADYSGARDAAATAGDAFPPASPEWFQAQDELFVATSRLGDSARAMQTLHAITTIDAPQAAEIDRLRSIARCAILLSRFGPPEIGERLANRVEQIAASVTIDPHTEQRLHGLRAIVARTRGDIEGALAASRASRAAAEQAHNIREVAFACLGLGNSLDEIGSPREAIVELDRGIAVAERINGGTVLALLYVVRAWAHHHAGDDATARADIARVMTFNDVAVTGLGHLLVTWIALGEGDLVTARERIELALAAIPQATQFYALALAARADLGLELGELATAREDIAAARRAVRPSSGFEDGEATVRLIEIKILERMGDRSAAAEATRDACLRLRERALRIAESWRAKFLARPDHVATFEYERRFELAPT